MITTRLSCLAVLLALFSAPDFQLVAQSPVVNGHGNHPVLRWNEIALNAVVDDHSGTFGAPEQGGPTRTSRALAIVHLAIYDAVNAIVGGHQPYIPVDLPALTLDRASVEAAVARAAHDTLVSLYPSQQPVFQRELDLAVRRVPKNRGRDEGIAVGAEAAVNIWMDLLRGRLGDGGDAPDLPFDFDQPKVIGGHRPDPLNPNQGLLTPKWGLVAPFAMNDVAHFHALPPPWPDSTDDDPATEVDEAELERLLYADAFDEVKRLGGDGFFTPTERTAEQTEIGLFWGYDGSVGLGVPPRLYNQIARVIAKQDRNSVAENARLFALVNLAMADAGIASWYSKYAYDYWRPIVAIRCGDEDDNEFTTGDPDWTPLGAPATNESNGGIDFTPPFPAYNSGHATFGAATFRTLANLYGDDYPFQLKSDELNGRNTDSGGNHRHAVVRRFDRFSDAARENADSRVCLGIHWFFDADEGIAIGNAVADYAFDKYLQPLP